jgi:hypothetical protein
MGEAGRECGTSEALLLAREGAIETEDAALEGARELAGVDSFR